MKPSDFIPTKYKSTSLDSGSFTWKSPSNIALIKYWGKHGEQLPKNASLSLTLNACCTTTTLKFRHKEHHNSPKNVMKPDFDFSVYVGTVEKPDFKPKIDTFFKRIESYVPFIKDYRFSIETTNTFPHSSGIASSASGLSALSLCLMSIERALCNAKIEDSFLLKKASFLARLGSGSACRSIEGPIVMWGKNAAIEISSDYYGVKFPFKIHSNFNDFQDTILLVDQGQKEVSSTLGHQLMHNHPFAVQRFEQANHNFSLLTKVLQNGDLNAFVKIVETEALSLHAMMMTSDPYFLLMKPNTLSIIQSIWKYRVKTGLPVCFTLDAGANIHLLYPKSIATQVQKIIAEELSGYCNHNYINDQIGLGAAQVTSPSNQS